MPDGSFVRITARNKKTRSLISRGFIGSQGYRHTQVGRKQYRVHRLVAEAFLDDFDSAYEVDHINGDKADNRLENLRLMSRHENANAFRGKARGTSRYRGVSYEKRHKKWGARTMVNGKRVFLGRYDSEAEAAISVDRSRIAQGMPVESTNAYQYPEIKL